MLAMNWLLADEKTVGRPCDLPLSQQLHRFKRACRALARDLLIETLCKECSTVSTLERSEVANQWSDCSKVLACQRADDEQLALRQRM